MSARKSERRFERALAQNFSLDRLVKAGLLFDAETVTHDSAVMQKWKSVSALYNQIAYSPYGNDMCASIINKVKIASSQRQGMDNYFADNFLTFYEDLKRYLGSSQEFRSTQQGIDFWAFILLVRAYSEVFDLGLVMLYYFTGEISNIHIIGSEIICYASDGKTYLATLAAASSVDTLLALGSNLAQNSNGTFTKRFDALAHAVNLYSDYGHRIALRQRTPALSRMITEIRIHRDSSIDVTDMVAGGILSHEAADVLNEVVRLSGSMVVAGAPGSGKTTALRALSRAMGRLEPILLVENYRELLLEDLVDSNDERYFFVVHHHETQEANSEGVGEVPMARLLQYGLQEDVRRIIVGEVTDPDTMRVFMQALNTGQSGALTTIHAENISTVVPRITQLLTSSGDYSVPLSKESAWELIQSTLNVVVHMASWTIPNVGEIRRVTDIGWVTAHPGISNGMPQVVKGFSLDRSTNTLVRGTDYAMFLEKLKQLRSVREIGVVQ